MLELGTVALENDTLGLRVNTAHCKHFQQRAHFMDTYINIYKHVQSITYNILLSIMPSVS